MQHSKYGYEVECVIQHHVANTKAEFCDHIPIDAMRMAHDSPAQNAINEYIAPQYRPTAGWR